MLKPQDHHPTNSGELGVLRLPPGELPPAYGYMRAVDGMSERQGFIWEHGMKTVAERRGLWLAGIYEETVRGSLSAFNALVSAVAQTGVRNVLVPSLDHLAMSPTLRGILLERLEVDHRAEVHAVEEAGGEGDGPDSGPAERGSEQR
jgi:hypothetical protein